MGDANLFAAGVRVAEAVRLRKDDPQAVMKEMRERIEQIGNELEILTREVDNLERERNVLQYRCAVLSHKLAGVNL